MWRRDCPNSQPLISSLHSLCGLWRIQPLNLDTAKNFRHRYLCTDVRDLIGQWSHTCSSLIWKRTWTGCLQTLSHLWSCIHNHQVFSGVLWWAGLWAPSPLKVVRPAWNPRGTLLESISDTLVRNMHTRRLLEVWCESSSLKINVSKTKEMVIDFIKNCSRHACGYFWGKCWGCEPV